MTRSPRITLAMLKATNACRSQVELFARTFPNGAPLTLATYRKCVAVRLDFFWAEHLLSTPAWVGYAKTIFSAKMVFVGAAGPSGKIPAEAFASAWDAYIETCASALLRALRTSLKESKP